MTEIEWSRLEANKWVIAARWYYASGVLLIGLLSKSTNLVKVSFPTRLMLGLFALVVLLNAVFYLIARSLERFGAGRFLGSLGLAQILTELALLTTIMQFAGGLESVVPILFFIPIVESTVLFGFWGPVLAAMAAGLAINGLVIFQSPDWLTELPRFADLTTGSIAEGLTLGLIQTASVTLVYLMVGVFSAYLARLLKDRTTQLGYQAIERERQLAEFERLNKSLEEYNRKLYAKDIELTLVNERLQSLEKAKSRFISVTTHQLRTPLSALKWTFDMAVKGQLGPLTADQKQFLNKGYDSTKRIINIVNDLLGAEQAVGQGDLEKFKFVPLRLEELVASVIFEFANQAESKKINLTVAKPNRPLPVVETDPLKLRVVLENLLDNAIKYTPPDGQVTVYLDDARINASQPTVEVVVTDTGVGISPEDQKRIFQKFFRAKSALVLEPDGTGLGLYIAKDIIDRHGGTIWFFSEPGRGTSFHFTLPLTQTKRQPVASQP